MVSSPNRIGSRRGFTLIELLVVILIIAVLVGLLLPAINGIRERANIATAQNDISQISVAIGNWQTSNSSKWLIDNIRMAGGVNAGGVPNMTVTPVNDLAGFDWLKRTWPRLDVTMIPGTTMDPYHLNTGGKCLVFFLMGPNGQGSNKSSTNPLGDGTGQLQSPFLDFPRNRISAPTNSTVGEILDPWGTPYVYFASRGSSGYQAFTFPWTNPDGEPSQVAPYVEPGSYTGRAKFANQMSFQIISAGPDRRFGPGGVNGTNPIVSNWTPEQGQYVEGQAGFDDLSNFSGGKQLGVK